MASILKVNEIQHTGGTTALTIDSSGVILQPAKPAFKAYNNAEAWQSFGTSGVYHDMPFNTEDHDVGGNYDTSTYTFTCPVDGVYMFGAQYLHDATNQAQIRIFVNGTTGIAFTENSVQGDMTQIVTTHHMTSGDTVKAQGKVGNTNADDWYATLSYSFFFGYLVS
jgi:hypothetical protein